MRMKVKLPIFVMERELKELNDLLDKKDSVEDFKVQDATFYRIDFIDEYHEVGTDKIYTCVHSGSESVVVSLTPEETEKRIDEAIEKEKGAEAPFKLQNQL